ncbi:LysR family transcriptional regulator [Candidatus Woesearchaeota archaeon]|nr:LysR family transcriptional regulator [Candidatus Woesearchaeota archaeon]
MTLPRLSTPGEVRIPDWIDGELKLAGGLNERLFGLLEAIGRTGSINQAARELGLSYKGAWEMVERANNISVHLLVSSATGGRHGGGTRLTPAGERLVKLFLQLKAQHRAFLTSLNQQLAAEGEFNDLFRRSTMQASARNQLFGIVHAIRPGILQAEIELRLKGDVPVVANITRESAERLDIRLNDEVIALIKASSVMIVKDFGDYRLSARNQLKGTVSRIEQGAVNVDVVIQLQGGDSVAATVTCNSFKLLGLAEGDTVTAVFKAGAVILAVAPKQR